MNNEPNAHIGHRALAVKAFGVTDKGRVRPSNEDQFLSAELTKAMRIWQTSLPEPKAQFGIERGHLFLVADGMGGHRAGEQASPLPLSPSSSSHSIRSNGSSTRTDPKRSECSRSSRRLSTKPTPASSRKRRSIRS